MPGRTHREQTRFVHLPTSPHQPPRSLRPRRISDASNDFIEIVVSISSRSKPLAKRAFDPLEMILCMGRLDHALANAFSDVISVSELQSPASF